MVSRLEAMDAQRFDLSKRRSRSALSIMTHATSGCVSSLEGYRSSSMDHSTFALDSSETTSETGSSTSVEDFDITEFTATTLPSNTSSASLTLGRGPNTSETRHSIDYEKEDDCGTTCTIIRPMARPSIRDFFSRPTSPTTLSRSSSPIIFNTLNCFGSTDAFEDDVDQIQLQRTLHLAGYSGIRVLVTEETQVYAEELWRGAVQEMLYGDRPIQGIQSVIMSP